MSQSNVKEAIACLIDGELRDVRLVDESMYPSTIVDRNHPKALEVLRHDAAHLLAQAVKELYPETQVSIGPAIKDGFYYDFYKSPAFVEADLQRIEKRMHKIVDRNDSITRHEWSRNQAISFFKDQGEHFKVQIIESIPENEVLSVYTQGKFTDLCRGPHLLNTKSLGHAFKLTHIAGAYFQGDSTKPMLQRIYGTCWPNEKALEEYLFRREEAKKRDHRLLGKQMDLFHLQGEAQGGVFWHAKGWVLYRTVEEYMRRVMQGEGYQEVKTPQLLNKQLWEKSGHWEKFRDNMIICDIGEKGHEEKLALKPMNCPCHVEIFKQGNKSYKDLPLKMSEFGSCIRFEPSGSLFGIMRTRHFVQDDAHIFCTPEQIASETKRFCALLERVYKDFGLTTFHVKFADRPPVRAGEDKVWDRAEDALKKGAEAAGLICQENKGEGAFYGPKLEFVLKDALGREWQCGTLQVDFVLPQRLGATYTDQNGQKQVPVMLHRAVLGSLERFIGILIEHYGGHFPLWLAPVQVVVLPITNTLDAYAAQLLERLKKEGVRAEIDLSADKIGYKIRHYSLQKIPQLWIVGETEEANQSVSIRTLGSRSESVVSLDAALKKLVQEISAIGPRESHNKKESH